jgi:hypothetical protein
MLVRIENLVHVEQAYLILFSENSFYYSKNTRRFILGEENTPK